MLEKAWRLENSSAKEAKESGYLWVKATPRVFEWELG
jgi:hypothetical protein